MIDIAKSVSMLDVSDLDLDKQDDLLKSMNEFFRHHFHQIYVENSTINGQRINFITRPRIRKQD